MYIEFWVIFVKLKIQHLKKKKNEDWISDLG